MSKRAYKKIAYTAILSAIAAVLGYIDAILPVLDFLPLPGVKLGLANLAVLLALYLFGIKEAAAVDLIRILLVNLLLFPSFTAFLYSAAGGALSFAAMVFLKRMDFHPLSVSLVGAICHNVAQTLVAVILLHTPQLFYYLAFLLPVGCLCGILLGLLTLLILPRIALYADRTL